MSTKFNFWEPTLACSIGGLVQKDFEPTKYNGFDVLSHLPVSASIAQAEFVQAAPETGYRPQHAWPTTLWMGAAEQAELGQFLSQRAQSVASMFDFDAGRMLPKRFSKCLESSEWSAMSYMVGQIGATIAIRHGIGWETCHSIRGKYRRQSDRALPSSPAHWRHRGVAEGQD